MDYTPLPDLRYKKEGKTHMDIDHHARIDAAHDAALLARIEQMSAYNVWHESQDPVDLYLAEKADKARLDAEKAYNDAISAHAHSVAHRLEKRQTEQEEILERAFTKIEKKEK